MSVKEGVFMRSLTASTSRHVSILLENVLSAAIWEGSSSLDTLVGVIAKL